MRLLNKNSHVHLVGIGGVSMSGIAKVLAQRGYKVSGSDLNESKYIGLLSDYPIEIYIGHNKSNIKGADLIVKTSAVPDDNPEITAAKKADIPILKRAEMLAYLMKDKITVAVAGTHGKTTTTAMLAAVLEKAKKEPAVMVGGYLEEISGNIADGRGDYFITEADESDGSFFYFDPSILLLTNLELDHPDYYKDLENFKSVFKRFADKNDKKALVLYNSNDKNLIEILRNRHRTLSFSAAEDSKKSNYSARNIEYINKGSRFEFYEGEKLLMKLELSVPGEYNIYNALAAAAAASVMEIDKEDIKKALKGFSGVGRRFEVKGQLLDGKVDIVDDYAHHPTEIKSLLKAVKNMNYKKITAVFQPHRYSRTKRFFDEFAESFADADFVYLTDIFSASENIKEPISMKEFEEQINNKSAVKCRHISDFDKITEEIRADLTAGELVITIGAGDVNLVCDKLLK